MPRPDAPCRLKAARFSLPVLHLRTADTTAIADFIHGQMEQARALLEDAPVLLAPDETLAESDTETIEAIVETCRQHRLFPVGLAQCEAATGWQARSTLRKLHTGPLDIDEQATPPASNNRCIQGMVRSGQQAMAPEGSLTILGTVSATAEVLARDDIHVHGSLRGKALAGIQGQEQARIVCQRFEAELVAIAGHYRLFDEPDPALFGKAVCVSLKEDQLQFSVLPGP